MKDQSIIEMTPSKPIEKDDISDEFILTPSMSGEQSDSVVLTLEAESVAKVEEVTFEGEEEAEAKIEEAMIAYDEAMDQAAGIK